ncbi:hypothetical protein EUGRSUZ_K01873 [Eucalyptus grandis]|uniref:Uncharacterized protein n=2 Tax=Eucalyptus grandis TaxID=71139 RepID=A0A059A387_EUCGR|nr:hypothetical protein EUGRSUZ_K01873 [Eucalyptus grandis]
MTSYKEVLGVTEAHNSDINRGAREKKVDLSFPASQKYWCLLNKGSLEKTIHLYQREFVLPSESIRRH